MNSKKQPLVSVVIPSLDGSRGGNVDRLREQIKSQTYKNTEFHVVVGVRPNGRARNVGAERVKGDYLLFIDDDVRLGSDDLIEKMLSAFEEDKKIVLVGVAQQIPPEAGEFSKKCARQLERFETSVVEQVEDTDFASHACMMIPRQLYWDIGAEHPLLPRGTDPDLRYRLRQAGYRVVLAPGAWVYHPPPENWRQLGRIYFRNGAGSLAVQRHFPQFTIDTSPGHDPTLSVEKRPLSKRIAGYFSRLLKTLIPPRPIPLLALLAYGCGALKTLFFDKQQWSLLIRKLVRYAFLPFGWLRVMMLKATGRWPKRAVRMLLYHRVEDIRKYPLVIRPEVFRKQMEYLKANYQLIEVEETFAFLEGEVNGLRVAVTFDDGYEDNATGAWPVLKDLGIPAAFYLVTDYIGHSDEEFPWMKKLGPPAYRIMNWEQAERIAREGASIAPHSASHPSLSSLSEKEQEEEVIKSKVEIEKRLGVRTSNFCYPYGSFADFNETTVEVLRKNGFHSAVTAVSGLNDPSTGRFELRRTAIDPCDDFFLFKCQLKGYLDILAWKDSPRIGGLKKWLRNRVGL